MIYHHKQKDTVLLELSSHMTNGLCENQVTERKKEFGENRLQERKKKTMFQCFIKQFQDAMTDPEPDAQVKTISVYARVSPENKIRIVKAWQRKKQVWL